jgi:hypothetical protein
VWRRFQEYFLDAVRHDMFVLRNELFFKVASGEIELSFNSEIYRAFERYCNLHIRHAQRIRLFNIITTAMLLNNDIKARASQHEQDLNNLLNALPEEHKVYFTSLKKRIDTRMFKYLLASDVNMWLFAFASGVVAIIEAFSASPVVNVESQHHFQINQDYVRSEMKTIIWSSQEDELLVA